jgi:hypothetical protein
LLELKTKKPGTGDPLHTKEPVTVASFRTWRGWRENVARDRCLTSDSNKKIVDFSWRAIKTFSLELARMRSPSKLCHHLSSQ